MFVPSTVVLPLGTLFTLLGFLFSNTLCAWDLIRLLEFWNSLVRRVIGMVLPLGTLSTLLGFLFSNTLCAWDLIRLNSRIDWYDAS